MIITSSLTKKENEEVEKLVSAGARIQTQACSFPVSFSGDQLELRIPPNSPVLPGNSPSFGPFSALSLPLGAYPTV